MDQTEKVFERLKSGEQWDNVLSESGKITAFKAVNHFFTWAGPQVKTLQNSIKENEDKLTNLNRKITLLNSKHARSNLPKDSQCQVQQVRWRRYF